MLRSLIAPPGGDAPPEAPEDAADAPKKKKKAKKKPLLFEATARGGPLLALLGWLRAAHITLANPRRPANIAALALERMQLLNSNARRRCRRRSLEVVGRLSRRLAELFGAALSHLF